MTRTGAILRRDVFTPPRRAPGARSSPHRLSRLMTHLRAVRYSLRVTQRRRDILSLATLSLGALILGHHLVFLTAYGPQYWAMLERSGHGPVWAVTVITVAILSTGLVFLVLRRLASLARLARAAEGGKLAVRDARARDLVSHVIRLWAVIIVASLALFVLNENLERLANGLPTPGLTILAAVAGHPSPILVFAAVALAVALVAGLYRWRRGVLLARVRGERQAWARTAQRRLARPSAAPRRRPRSVVGSHLAGRAPPPLPRLSTV